MTSNRYPDCEWLLVRDWNMPPRNGREGYTLGKLYFERDADHICETLEDQDRRLEEGLQQIGGPAAMPLGRYQLTLYRSMRYGLVPMFNAVPTYKYCTRSRQSKCLAALPSAWSERLTAFHARRRRWPWSSTSCSGERFRTAGCSSR